jgi:hypothetical protein
MRRCVDIHEWHEYWRGWYAEQERHEREVRRYRRLRRLILAGIVLFVLLNVFVLAYIRYSAK